MRTSLNLDDKVLAAAKRQAAREGITLTSVVDRALRQYLASQRRDRPSGFRLDLKVRSTRVQPGVDIEDRDSLYDVMEDRR